LEENKMFNIGRVCVKLAGRDAGKKCIVLKSVDENHVLIDGETRRRKCNLKHLEPLKEVYEINEDASFQEVQTIFKDKLSIELVEKKSKPATSRAKKTHVKREKAPKAEAKKTPAKKATKKAEVKADK
jgi:large subunit ribosomal protein L14e